MYVCDGYGPMLVMTNSQLKLWFVFALDSSKVRMYLHRQLYSRYIMRIALRALLRRDEDLGYTARCYRTADALGGDAPLMLSCDEFRIGTQPMCAPSTRLRFLAHRLCAPTTRYR